MIVGRGDLASALKGKWFEPSIRFLFFVSGVSNSLCEDENEFKRERDLLLSQNKNKHIIYFSTISIWFKDSFYTRHKLNMESLVKENFKSYTIIRIGNITWGANSNTLINFIKNKLINGDNFEVKDEFKFLINEKDLLNSLSLISDGEKSEFNLTGRILKVSEIVDLIGKKEI